MSVRSRIFKGIGANSFGQIVNLLIQLASVPILISSWGFDKYSEWIVISAIPTYLALSDLGVTTAASSKVVIWHERAKTLTAISIYSTSFIFLFTAAIIIIAGTLACLIFANIFELLNLKTINSSEGALILLSLTTYSMLCLLTNMVAIRYRTYKSYPLSSFIMNFIRMSEWALALAVAHFTQSLVYTSITLLITRLTGLTIKNLIATYLGMKLSLKISSISKRAFITLIKPSISSLAFPIGLAMNVQGLIIILSITISPGQAAIFSLYRTISRILVQLSAIVNQSIWPEISYAYSVGNSNLIKKMISAALKVSLPTATAIGLLIIYFGKTIFDAWSGRGADYSSAIMITLIIGAIINVGWQVYWVTLMATSTHSSFAVIFMLVSTSSTALIYYTSGIFGLISACYIIVFAEIILFLTSRKSFQNLKLSTPHVNPLSSHEQIKNQSIKQ